jgi:hypothetical protein
MAINKIKTNSISDSAVTSATIQDSAVTNAKISACAAIAQSKVTGLASSLSTLCSSATSLTGLINTNQYNFTNITKPYNTLQNLTFLLDKHKTLLSVTQRYTTLRNSTKS